MHALTPGPALLGGLLIGASSLLLLGTHGRIAGISGITGGILCPKTRDKAWRIAFVAGLVLVGAIAQRLRPVAWPPVGVVPMAVAGLLVGFGTRLGSGCTSGHGVCGISRGSLRSVVATGTFMVVGAITVLVARKLGGGS